MTLAEAQKVIGVVMTSSPGPIFSAASATCSPPVQELRARAFCAPMNSAKTCSKRWVFGPVVIQLERRVSTTASISSSVIEGGEKGRKVGRTGVISSESQQF